MKTIAERYIEGVFGAMKRFTLVGSLLFALTGCLVFMAAKLPDKKNLEVLTPGEPPPGGPGRDGPAVQLRGSQRCPLRGVQVQAGLFPGGENIPGRAAWNGRHLDLRPLGGRRHTPTEYYFSGTDTIVLITYDRNERVEAVEYFRGGGKSQ